jgi:hypothetical protein
VIRKVSELLDNLAHAFPLRRFDHWLGYGSRGLTTSERPGVFDHYRPLRWGYYWRDFRGSRQALRHWERSRYKG